MIHYSYVTFILLLVSLSQILSLSLSLLLTLSLLSLSLYLQLSSKSSTKYFSVLGEHNENKSFLLALRYPCHFFPCIKKIMLFIFQIKCSKSSLSIAIHSFIFIYYVFNQELAFLYLWHIFLSMVKYNLLNCVG